MASRSVCTLDPQGPGRAQSRHPDGGMLFLAYGLQAGASQTLFVT
ncbi:hypothetical protein AB0J40_10500 [Amycolatopsis sp. NPDC049691]